MMFAIEGLTERQRLVLEAVVGLTEARGYPPSLAELKEAVGLSSQNALRCHLLVLRRKGFVEWQDGKARTIRLAKAVEERTRAYLAGNISGVAAAYRTRGSAEERVALENATDDGDDWEVEEVPLYV